MFKQISIAMWGKLGSTHDQSTSSKGLGPISAPLRCRCGMPVSMRRDGTVGWEGDVPDFEGHLFSFSFFSFFSPLLLVSFWGSECSMVCHQKKIKKSIQNCQAEWCRDHEKDGNAAVGERMAQWQCLREDQLISTTVPSAPLLQHGSGKRELQRSFCCENNRF